MSSVVIAGDTSGSVTIAAPAIAGTTVITLPATTGTLLASGGALGTPSSGTLTNCTGLPVAGGGTGVTTSTGSGANVLGTSPTLTTPTFDSASLATISGTAPLYMCRAWVNFNGTGTVAIRASGNVSSITDNGVGLYTVNFTTAMPDANYSVCGSSSWETTVPNAPGTIGPSTSGTYTASAIRISVGQGTGTLLDVPYAMVHIFR